eukprot:5547498-Amphidinium_carterae.1
MHRAQGLRVVHKIAGVSIIRSGEAMETALKAAIAQNKVLLLCHFARAVGFHQGECHIEISHEDSLQ